MRLYLSSFRLGHHARYLQSLVGAGARALVVVNSCDLQAPHKREGKLEREIVDLSALGFSCQELDLRNFFDESSDERLKRELSRTDLLWVRGGNIFVLMRAVKKSGLDRLLIQMLQEDRFAYGGYSAGVDVLAGDLHGTELVDDPHLVPENYPREIVWQGLGMLPFAVAPHYRSDHPESASVEALVQHYIDNHVAFLALRDGEVIIREGDGGFRVLGLHPGRSTRAMADPSEAH